MRTGKVGQKKVVTKFLRMTADWCPRLKDVCRPWTSLQIVPKGCTSQRQLRKDYSLPSRGDIPSKIRGSVQMFDALQLNDSYLVVSLSGMDKLSFRTNSGLITKHKKYTSWGQWISRMTSQIQRAYETCNQPPALIGVLNRRIILLPWRLPVFKVASTLIPWSIVDLGSAGNFSECEQFKRAR